MATVEREGVLELLSSLLTKVITGVGHPSVSLHEDGGTKVLVLVPPVGGAGRGAASAENALVKTVETTTLLGRLKVLSLSRGVVGLEERLDGTVLLVELGQVRNKILDDVHVREGVDLGVVGLVDSAKTSKGVDTVMFMAQEPQIPSRQERRKVRVGSISFLILIKASSTIGRLVEIKSVGLKTRLLGRLVGVPAVDLELLQVLGLARARSIVGGRGETGSCGCREGSSDADELAMEGRRAARRPLLTLKSDMTIDV